MTEAKQVKRKSKRLFWVLVEKDEVLVRHYSGPDKGRARAVAEKFLRDSPKETVIVAKVAALRVLDISHLQSSLPRDAF